MVGTTERTTIDQFQLAFPIRAMNQIGEWLESAHLKVRAIDADALVARAKRETGLSDWGDDSFLENYKVQIHNFAQKTDLHLLGRLGMRQEFLRVLTNRLRHVELLKQHPEILEIPIQQPIFILGLPRTGSTMLHKLFAQDTANLRVAPLWQLIAPFPLTDDPRHIKHRIRYAEITTKLTYFVAPLFHVMHQFDAYEPEECVFLMTHHLVRHAQGEVPGYVKWYLEYDALADYRYFKQQLQILQWHQPVKRWVMKTPFHLFKLESLLEVFPDARLIQTHRDPAKVIPSWCSFQTAVGMMYRSHVNPLQVGQDWLCLWSKALDLGMTVRDAHPEAQFFDLYYADLIPDPVKMVEQICGYFDLPYSEATADKMRGWLSEEVKTQQQHRYNAAQFGLTEAAIHQRFKRYMERFNVRHEP